MLIGSLDQWVVKFQVSFGQSNFIMNVLQMEVRSTLVTGLNLPLALIYYF